ncbi:MAG: formate dehydrogenase accessory sulfurtransferase FdhD, partial [Bacteroidota bacterium]|nr:formate dehydrogenase accessory sulfurtransferase FdhD [Bacteroidota bacterium]MDX5431541.1 formate dehydrogenase accessory sulfurtransferase FdhD [Bacteroidota bacterium]MDX5470262.1 formate dehydrogenase accessory sulfurtransferase FdhD [Bacteroidota bacterium]
MSAARTSLLIHRWNQGSLSSEMDDVSVEEPLEIRLAFYKGASKQRHQVSVTMRTPGNDEELALGFLFTENLIPGYELIESVQRLDPGFRKSQRDNIIQVNLKAGFQPDMDLLTRHFYTTSSCGVCGKTSIDLVQSLVDTRIAPPEISTTPALLAQLPEKLEAAQKEFSSTGAIHAACLFDLNGEVLALREDVGRHNALDKLIGFCLSQGQVPLDQHILLLSGRASFELLQKASMAGIQIVAAVGAPSSLAVQLADEAHITLVGFLKKIRMNI